MSKIYYKIIESNKYNIVDMDFLEKYEELKNKIKGKINNENTKNYIISEWRSFIESKILYGQIDKKIAESLIKLFEITITI